MKKPANKRFGRVTLAFEDDCYTPVMVYIKTLNVSATYYCAVETGECDYEPFTDAELKFLNDNEAAATEWYDATTINNPENA